MEIQKIQNITLDKVSNVLSATHISVAQKETFLKMHSEAIHGLIAGKINTAAFRSIMKNRPLKIFRPFKNSLTKKGDRKILAEVLGIEPSELDSYIDEVSEKIEEGDTDDLSEESIEKVKTYVYRHGDRNQVLTFLDYEISSAEDILGVLYRTLSYNAGGVADYYVRPIHRMNNRTLVSLYDVINKNLRKAKDTGNISETDKDRMAQWALVRIYEIQNNQKLQNAIKLKQKLEG